jgi:hypothetical protein
MENSVDRFSLVVTFNVAVLEGYNHDNRMIKFARKHRKEFASYNHNLTDKKYQGATTKLTPGRKFVVKVFRANDFNITTEECISFLRGQTVFVGAQGVTLVYEQHREKLPTKEWSVSFDEKDALWKDTNTGSRGERTCSWTLVPGIQPDSDGIFEFGLVDFYDNPNIEYQNWRCLLCFCEAS